jgi:hypothetical protein
MPRGPTVNSDLYIQTLKLCKTFSGEFDLPKNDPEILLINEPSTMAHKFWNSETN